MAQSYLRNLPMERRNERRARAGMAPYVPQEPTQTAGQALADTLGGVALGTTFIPGYGDVAGLAADAAMYANYPEERTLGNYALTALGALPFVPAASAVRSGRKATETALDMSQEARMARAKDMGLNKDVFHGTSEQFDEFDPDLSDIGVHVGSAEQATYRLRDLSDRFNSGARFTGNYETGANIMPLKARINNPLVMEDVGDWKDATQVLAGLRHNKAFAKDASKIEDMYQESSEIAEQYQYGDELWRDSPENREFLDEIRDMIKQKGYDSVKYLNQVENQYGSEGAYTAVADALIRNKQQEHSAIELMVRDRMPSLPDPSDPQMKEKMRRFLDAKMEDYASPDELEKMKQLRDEIAEIRNSPLSRNDPHSYIILDPKDLRSVNAAFDPAKKDSSNLMAGMGAAGVLTGSMRQQREEGQ